MTNGNRFVTTETFTRAGVTNLVRKTCIHDGKVLGVFQEVFYRGTRVLWIDQTDNGLTCSAEAVPGVDVGTHFTPEGTLDTVNLMTKELITVDHFTVTNGLIYPVSTAVLAQFNDITKDVKTLFSPANVRKGPPAGFGAQAVDLVNKHRKE